jgi:hypothetical protein
VAKRVGAVAARAMLIAGLAAAAGSSAPVTKTALFYGDSLTLESNWSIQQALGSNWVDVDQSVAGTAPCDWVPQLPEDLASYHPKVVTLVTAGNTHGAGSCERASYGTSAYLADYRAALAAFVNDVTGAGAQMVFVEAPPFKNTPRDSAVTQINAIESDLANNNSGVTVDTAARETLSDHGRYTQDAPCLPTENAAMGCSSGKVPLRTLPGHSGYGLHFCPIGFSTLDYICQVYSSGELRFGRALADAARHPNPVIP